MFRVPMIFMSSFKCKNFHQSKRTLAFMLPGLKPFEQNYVNKQVSIILNHKYKSADEEKELLKQYTNENFILCSKKKNLLLLVKRIFGLMEDKEISNTDDINRCLQVVNYIVGCNRFYKRSMSIPKIQDFGKVTSILLKQEKGVTVPDFVKFYQNRNKTQPLGKEPALIPVESIYLNEELNFETFKEELKVLKLAEVKVSEHTDLLRNLYIITQLFGLSICDTIQERENSIINIGDFCTQLQSTNPLEVLIQLNVYEQLLLQDVDNLKDKKIYLQNLIFTVFYPITESSFLMEWDLSPVLYFTQLLTALGFGLNTIRYLFLTRYIPIIACVKKLDLHIKKDYSGDFKAAEDCLVERNSMMEVTEVSTCQRSDIEQILVLFTSNYQSDKSIRLERNVLMTPKLKAHICSNFGETAYDKLIRAYAFTFRWEKDKNLQVYLNLNFLESFGFSVEQIAQGIQVLVYPAARLETIIKEIDSEPQNYPGLSSTKHWKSDPKALQLVSYYLEKSEGFKSRRQGQGRR